MAYNQEITIDAAVPGDETEGQPILKKTGDVGDLKSVPDVEVPPSMGRKVYFLEVAVVFFYMALMSFYPIIQQYIYHRVLTEELSKGTKNSSEWEPIDGDDAACGGNVSSGAEAIAQQDAAQWLLYFGLAINIPGILSTMILGAFTDFRGRKIGLVVPAAGSLVRTTLAMIVIGLDGPMELFILGGLVEGCCGSFGTVFMASFAYLADITQPGKQRTLRITVLQAAIGVCASSGLLGTGFLVQETGFFYPLFLGLGLLIANLLLVVFMLPETIKRRYDVRILDWERISSAFTCYFRPRSEGRRWKLITLLVALFMVDMVQIGKAQIDTLFQLGTPFCWDAIKIGVYAGVSVLAQTFSMMSLLKPLQRCLSDNAAGIVGSLSGISQLVVTGLAVNDAMLYIAPFLGFLLGLPSAMLKAVMSTYVGRDEQGSLFAGICSIQMLCSSVGSVMFNAVYIATVKSFAGFVFILMAVLFLICMICMGIVEVFGRRSQYQRLRSVTD